MPPRGQLSKRKRSSTTDEPDPLPAPRRRTSDRVRESSTTPARQSARAGAESIEVVSPPAPSASRGPSDRPRQFARRSGAPLPPPQSRPAPVPVPASQRTARTARAPAVARSPAAPTPERASRASRSSTPSRATQAAAPSSTTRAGVRSASRLVVEIPTASPRTRTRAPSSRLRRDSSIFTSPVDQSFELSDDDAEGGEDDVGEAGPGPNTRANRALRPVPQPDPSVFRQYRRSPASPQTRLRAVQGKASQENNPSSQQDSLPRRREVTTANGEEAYVIGDSESADESEEDGPGPFLCPVQKCMQVVGSEKELGSHLRTHADKFDPAGARASGFETPSATRKKLAQLNKQHEEEKRKLEAELEEVKDEITKIRSKLNVTVSQGAAALQSASQLEVQLSGTQSKLKEKETAVVTLESQLATRSEEMDKLKAKVTAMEELDEEVEAITAPHAPLDGEVPSPEIQIKLLHKKIKKKVSALKAAESDVDFFRSQYQVASNSALTEVTRANELEAKVTKLEQQLQIGLKQRDLVSAAAAKEAKASATKADQQLKLLLEQSRRTDDALRRKAAGHGRLIRENQDLEAELHKARSRADDLSKRNTELGDQVALLRGRLIGAFDVEEEPSDDGEADMTDDDAPSLPGSVSITGPAAPPATTQLVPAFAPDNQSSRPSPALVDTTLVEGSVEMFCCKWNLDEDPICREIFHTRDELEAHGLAHIEKLATSIDAVCPPS